MSVSFLGWYAGGFYHCQCYQMRGGMLTRSSQRMHPVSHYTSHLRINDQSNACVLVRYSCKCLHVALWKTILRFPLSASLAVQFNEASSVVEHVPNKLSKLNIRCHSVDLSMQYFVVVSVQ